MLLDQLGNLLYGNSRESQTGFSLDILLGLKLVDMKGFTIIAPNFRNPKSGIDGQFLQRMVSEVNF